MWSESASCGFVLCVCLCWYCVVVSGGIFVWCVCVQQVALCVCISALCGCE